MSKRVRPKVRGKKDVLDEWEVADIDRDEQKLGLERRERRWKEIQAEQQRQRLLEKKAIKNAEKMKSPPNTRQPNELEMAWLRCDFVLWNMMDGEAYMLMEYLRTVEPDTYKHLYRIYMSKYMMENIEFYVDYFAQGHKPDHLIPKADVMKHYLKYKGYKSTIKIKRKGEEERDFLSE